MKVARTLAVGKVRRMLERPALGAGPFAFARASAAQLPLEPRLRNIAGRERGPCRLWSRRGRSIFRICYRRRLLEGWGGRSTGLGPERESGRRG